MTSARRALLVVCLIAASSTHAFSQVIPSQFDVLLDLDRDATTGCDVSTADGTFSGAEVRLTTGVVGTVVTSVERFDCVNPATNAFGVAQSIDTGDWPIGFGNGEAGFNVIETYMPIDSSFAGARIGVAASDSQSNISALLVVSAGGSEDIIIEGLTPVPLVDGWLLICLALTLVALALVSMKRRGATAALMIVLIAGAGRAVLIACTLDGQTSDWTSGDRLAGTNASDPTDGVTMRALFGSIDGGRLCFRIDAALQEDDTTLSLSASALALSINSPGADPALVGNPRMILVSNTGSNTANDLQVSTSGFPAGTSVTSNTCTGALPPGDTCTVTITPGAVASADLNANPCTTSPGAEPVPTTLTVSATNAPSQNANVVVLGYGCIYAGGYLFSVDDTTSSTSSIGGKVAALADETNLGWATALTDTGADSLTDGLANTNALSAPVGQYPAAQACLDKTDQGFTDWYLPAVCELSRFTGLGFDPGCGTTNPNLYTTLYINNLGALSVTYWSSTEAAAAPTNDAWSDVLTAGFLGPTYKAASFSARCVRAFTP